MEIKFYKDIEVLLIRATQDPMSMLQLAADLPMTIELSTDDIYNMDDVVFEYDPELYKKFIERAQRIFSMQHLSVFEFVDCTFLIKGISGALLRQIRTHRIASWMSTSQHYKDAVEFGYTFLKTPPQKVIDAIAVLEEAYAEEAPIIGKEEARMWLPVASSYNILMKMNMRTFVHFFAIRMCRRNIKEMFIVALKVYNMCIDYLPLFELMGPSCLTTGKCNQGKMCCGKPLTKGEVAEYATEH